MNVARIVEAIGVQEEDKERVISKAEELLRLINIKIPRGALNKQEDARFAVPVEFSCRILNISFNMKAIFDTIYGVSKSDYSKISKRFKNILGLKIETKSLFEILSVRFDPSLCDGALKILDNFKNQYVDLLDPCRRNLIDLKAPQYQAVAYFIAAKEKKVKVDKLRLIEVADIDIKTFNNLFQEMSILSPLKHNDDKVSTNENIPNQNNIKLTNDKMTKEVQIKITEKQNSNLDIHIHDSHFLLKKVDSVNNPQVVSIRPVETDLSSRHRRLAMAGVQVVNINKEAENREVMDQINLKRAKEIEEQEKELEEYKNWKETELRKRQKQAIVS